jgi:hypothetical protein
LTASRVDVSIVESRAEVTVTQTFRNATTSPLEATYVYPVEDGSAVCAFSADVDGRLIRAVVKEKQQVRLTPPLPPPRGVITEENARAGQGGVRGRYQLGSRRVPVGGAHGRHLPNQHRCVCVCVCVV